MATLLRDLAERKRTQRRLEEAAAKNKETYGDTSGEQAAANEGKVTTAQETTNEALEKAVEERERQSQSQTGQERRP